MYRFERFSLSTSQHKETFPFDMFFWFAQWSVCILKQNKRTGSIFVQYQQCCKWYDFTHKKIVFLYHPKRIIRHHMIHQVAEKMLMILLNYVCISSLLLGHTLVPSSLGNQFLSNRWEAYKQLHKRNVCVKQTATMQVKYGIFPQNFVNIRSIPASWDVDAKLN